MPNPPPLPQEQPHEPPAARPGDPVLLQRGNLVVTRNRLLQAGGILVLLLLGAVLPYVSLPYLDASSAPVVGRPRLFGAARLLGGLDPTYLPGYALPRRSDYDPALVFAPTEVMTAKAEEILRAGRAASGHVFNLGHGVLPETDPDQLARLTDFVHAWPVGDGAS